MADARDMEVVKPYQGDPFVGHLSTPISDSAFTRAFIGNLPAYRKGLSPFIRGLEIGMAHGYFLVGPEVVFGALRDYPEARYLGGLVTALVLVLLGTAGIAAWGLVSLKSSIEHPPDVDRLKTSEGWSELAGGFFVGGMGGAFVAYFLLENFETVDAIFRGFVNNP
ncbi:MULTISPECIES: photosystem I reaction center protein subunit XI [unclassified Coleofasciculus]|uniref:photosystem I reaction center protein subunit XI n=1 Tax=unclassified Coleofasciculus TaxID=2692782 RepID=UPI001880199B|nr:MULTISPECIES: photosystem I reaction center protein subunit XI [unclassified Coleofasciculus]MBE9127227.1 photosystem I reaction center protein subunit XI [Coleofasciculus sp. LEGE 07081]MBE9150519.1 photosystem I reaction center protein subunit XI [Coleofasciculus sp. LEGE 07092]